jgi:uncharacterized protein
MIPDLLTLEALDQYLSSEEAPDDCMLLSELDGFMTAIVVGPSFIDPTVWFPKALGIAFPRALGPNFIDRVVYTVVNRYNKISTQLSEDPDSFEPIFWESKDGIVVAMDWAEGFRDGMKLRMAKWRSIISAPGMAQLLYPILVHCSDGYGKSLLGLSDADEERTLETAYLDIPKVLPFIRDFYMPQRAAESKAEKKRDARKRR